MATTISDQLPVCVDLDGTLIKTDLLLESFLILFKKKPWVILKLPFWLLKGKAYLKGRIAREVKLDIAVLPYHQALIDVLEGYKNQGRKLILTTASHRSYAEAVGHHTKLFTEILATDEVNNAGHNKAESLVKRFGSKGFDYIGNSKADMRVWEHARKVVVVNPEIGVTAMVKSQFPDASFIDDRSSGFLALIKTLRLHQWVKNALIFVPLLAAHQIGDLQSVVVAIWAFLAFGLCASSVYVVNDLLDLEADRHHARKHKRGFASGQITIIAGIVLVPVLLALAICISILFLPIKFLLALAVYYILTTVYSFWAKKRVVLDVMFLAGLYTMRILAGAAANTIYPSFWLLAFSMFIFLSLALVKRYSELLYLLDGKQESAKGRGYVVEDLAVLSSLGGASGYLSVLVLALYINSPEVNSMYTHPKALWALCPMLLFWISRVWFKTHRGEMHDDPVVFAVKDFVSLITLALFGIGFLGAIIPW